MAAAWLAVCACALAAQSVVARIDVAVDGASKRVDAAGSDQAIITDTERRTFGIEDYGLKKAVEVAFGQSPTDVFVRSPTPWGDLYKNYKWKEVRRTLHPTSAKIVTSNIELVTLASKGYANNGTSRKEIKTPLFKQESQTITHSWIKNADVSSGIQLTYKIKFAVDSSNALMSLSYKNGWGNSKTVSEPVRIGFVSGVKFKLEPGHKATAALVAERETIDVQVNYEVSLEGQAALNYRETYKGHHFWGYDVNNLISTNKLPLTYVSTENIKLIYYSNAKILVTDENSKNVITEVPVPIDFTENFSNLRYLNID